MSSGLTKKGRGFIALVYMHRYDKTLLAKMRTDYLLELEAKLDARMGMLSESARDKQEKEKLGKLMQELAAYDEKLNNKARITTKSNSYDYIKLDLSKEQLTERFLSPYENGTIIVIDGKSIEPDDIEQIRINRTEVDPSTSISQMRAERKPPTLDFRWYVTDEDKDITDELILGPPGYKKSDNAKEKSKRKVAISDNKKVFIVHGHDEEMKQTVARVLEKLDLEPIILHEIPNTGKTIIEKFEDCSEDISFAIVLLSPDDKGCELKNFPDSAKLRAHQNVILELGYFIGKLGRNKVLVLVKKENDFECPSDISGILFTPFNKSWEMGMVKELRSSGYNVDSNKLL